LLVFFI